MSIFINIDLQKLGKQTVIYAYDFMFCLLRVGRVLVGVDSIINLWKLLY